MSEHKRGLAVILTDTNRTRVPVDFGTPLWEASMEWAKRHGIDPSRVPAGSAIVVDTARYEIHYDEYVLDPVDGGPLIRDGEPVVVRRVERGEGPPMPFPEPAL